MMQTDTGKYRDKMDESKKNKKEEIPELTEKDRLACKKHQIMPEQ